MGAAFTLSRNTFGRLVLTDAAGTAHAGVVAVRAFPLAAPDEGISLLGRDGHELAWIEHLRDLDDDARAQVQAELADLSCTPVIERLVRVSSFATPCTWTVATDRGDTQFVLEGEENIRRLPGGALLIASAQGIYFRIAEPIQLDRHSRRLLERFL